MTLVLAPFTARTWRQTLHLLIGALVSVLALAFVVVTACAMLASVTVVGLAVLGPIVVAARSVGVMERARARRLLGLRVTTPAPFARGRPGPVGWVRDALADTTGWRCLLYSLIAAPVGVAQAYLVGLWWLLSLTSLCYPLWYGFVPVNSGHHSDEITIGAWHWYPDTWPYPMLVCAVGLVGVVCAPWLVSGLTRLDQLRIRGLLGPSAGEELVRALRRHRTRAVEQAGSQLRRIERDLHDGAQARLVALAMELGRAREDIARGRDPDRIAARVATAHEQAKQSLVELRDLARGIYPAVLTDLGLDGAVPLLTAHCPVPVHTDIEVPDRPDDTVEATAYFCIAELLTNVAKHSHASSATVRVRRGADLLLIEVSDDGVGGAAAGSAGGLAGLSARVDSLGGAITLSSPPHGPTRITMELPCAL